MAFADFYMQTTGDNLNSGSDTNDAAAYTSTGGNFDGTSVFTPTDGSTPASFISVGDWVSLYNTGDAAVRCLTKVTNVAGGVNGAVTIDTTNKFGTVPTVNSGSRNLKKGGAWASLGICASNTAFNTGTAPLAFRIYIKAGTYANTTTARAFGVVGTATINGLLEGYKTTAGDMETQPIGAARVPGTDIPLFTWTTQGLTIGNFIQVANIAFQTANSGVGVTFGNAILVDRVQVNNTSTNAAARAATVSGGIYNLCRFTVGGTTAGEICVVNGTATAYLNGCIFDGGETGLSSGSISSYLRDCRFVNQSTTAILLTTGAPNIVQTTIAGALTDAIKWSGTVTGQCIIMDNIFDGLAGTMTNAINNASGTNVNRIIHRNNRYRSVTNPQVGLGETYTPTTAKTGSETNFTNAAGGDFTLAVGSTAIANASPGTFEGEIYKSYKSMGAYQPQSTVTSNQPTHTQTIVQNIGTY